MRSSSGQESTSMQFSGNPFAQPLKHVQQTSEPVPHVSGEAEESKGQPAGVAIDDRAHPLRLLVLADDFASFYKLQGESQLVEDTSLPRYHQAKLARFAPLNGHQASIVDELGIHFVSTQTKQETLFIAQSNIDGLKYSPADSCVAVCEKYNLNNPDNPNLRIIETKTGHTIAEFIWKKSAKEGLKTLLWSPDESVCLRMAPPEAPAQPN